jgi:hypothetical protein
MYQGANAGWACTYDLVNADYRLNNWFTAGWVRAFQECRAPRSDLYESPAGTYRASDAPELNDSRLWCVYRVPATAPPTGPPGTGEPPAKPVPVLPPVPLGPLGSTPQSCRADDGLMTLRPIIPATGEKILAQPDYTGTGLEFCAPFPQQLVDGRSPHFGERPRAGAGLGT